MSITKLILLVGLSFFFVSCSTPRLADMPTTGNTTTDMGVRYLLGRGVPQSDAKAFYYFKQAANDNDPFAQNEIAYMYAAGKGTPRDYSKAFLYYLRAANHGLASAQYSLGLMYEHGLGTPRNHDLAIQWFKRSAQHGFEPAQIALQKYR